MSPPGVPGPTRVSSSFSSFDNMRYFLLELQHLRQFFLELEPAVLSPEIEGDRFLRLLQLDSALFDIARHPRTLDEMGRDELVFFEQRLSFLGCEESDEELRDIGMGGVPRHAQLKIRRQNGRGARHGDER